MVNAYLKKYPTAAPVIFLVLMIVLPYWKLATMQGFIITDDVFTSDIMNEGFPYRHYISEALKNGELPTWLPYIYGGIPLLARAEAGVCYPLNLVLFGLMSPYVALNLVILLTLITAALAMYFYARELEAGIIGAIAAGLAFAYSGFMVSHIKHLSMVGTVCWFPLGLLIIERAVRRSSPKTLLWLSLVFGLQNLSGHTQTAYYSGLMYLCYFVFRLLSLREKAAPRKKKSKPTPAVAAQARAIKSHVLWFVAAMTLAVGISAIQLLPTYELVGLTQRSGGVTFDYAASYAYDPSNIKTFSYPHANGDISNATYNGKSIFWEDYGYVGLTTLLLAIFAAVKCWRRWHVRFFVITAIAAYVLVLGPNTPLYEAVFYLVPGMKFFRFPTRFLFIVDVSLAVLAALGMTQLFVSHRDKKKDQRSIVGFELVLLAVVIADLLYFQLRQNPIVNAQQWLAPPKTVQKLKDDKSLFRIYSPGASDVHKNVFAAAQGWSGSLQPYIDHREFIQASSNVLYGLFSADGYAQLTPNYVVDIWGDQNRSGVIRQTASLEDGKFIVQDSFLKLMNLFNVKYIISPWPVVSSALEMMEQNKGVMLYRNPNVLPRAFLVGKYRIVANPDIAKAILLSADFDPAHEVILYKQPSSIGSNRAENSSVTVEHYNTNEVIMNVSSASGGLLVLSDTFYPGWKGEVDGTETTIYQANVCQRAVVVPGGNHKVRFQFASSSIAWGFGISLCSMAAVVALAMMKEKKKA